MKQNAAAKEKQPAMRKNAFLLAAALQLTCGLVFIADIIAEIGDFSQHTWFELLGVVALVIGATITISQYRQILRRNSKVELQLDAATGAFQEVMEHNFRVWGLTAAERDVALLSIKGVPIADIATMRNTRAGTIKAQSAAIYRKSGVSSRAELLSTMVEELIDGLHLEPASVPASQPMKVG